MKDYMSRSHNVDYTNEHWKLHLDKTLKTNQIRTICEQTIVHTIYIRKEILTTRPEWWLNNVFFFFRLKGPHLWSTRTEGRPRRSREKDLPRVHHHPHFMNSVLEWVGAKVSLWYLKPFSHQSFRKNDNMVVGSLDEVGLVCKQRLDDRLRETSHSTPDDLPESLK